MPTIQALPHLGTSHPTPLVIFKINVTMNIEKGVASTSLAGLLKDIKLD